MLHFEVTEIYNRCSPEGLKLSPRTLLYPLPPIGRGTAFVESLTSYMTRLANAHGVNVAFFVDRWLNQQTIALGLAGPEESGLGCPVDLRRQCRSINGLRQGSTPWVATLEAVTGVKNLHRLTLTALSDILTSRRGLSRTTESWCSRCLTEWQQTGTPPYGPLAWSLSVIEVCTKHKRRLETICPYCEQQFRPLLGYARPGFCSLCGHWLGEAPESPSQNKTEPALEEQNLCFAETMGELLARQEELGAPEVTQNLRVTLGAMVRKLTGGRTRPLAKLFSWSGAYLQGYLSGRIGIPAPTLLAICYELQVPVLDLLKLSPLRWEPSASLL